MSALARARARACAEVLAWFALGCVAWSFTYGFNDVTSGYRWGTASWPRGVIVLLMLAATLQWVHAMRATAGKPQSSPDAGQGTLTPAMVAIFALPLVYAWLLPRTGFFATTPVLVAALLWLLGERTWWRLVVVTSALYALVLLVFSVVLYVPLPAGTWPGFYDFSNLVLSLIR